MTVMNIPLAVGSGEPHRISVIGGLATRVAFVVFHTHLLNIIHNVRTCR